MDHPDPHEEGPARATSSTRWPTRPSPSQVAEVLVAETGSFGVRARRVERWPAARRFDQVDVDGHPIRIKVSPGRTKVEHDDAAAVARRTGRPLREVVSLAEEAARRGRERPDPSERTCDFDPDFEPRRTGVTILVDPAIWPWRGHRWAHLVSDESYDELHAFAARLGIPRRAFQGDHYDVPAYLRIGPSSSAPRRSTAGSWSAASGPPACAKRSNASLEP